MRSIAGAVRAGVIDLDKVEDAYKRQMTGLDDPGFCTECGAENDGCEPDARRYTCTECGKRAVYGAAEILLCSF